MWTWTIPKISFHFKSMCVVVWVKVLFRWYFEIIWCVRQQREKPLIKTCLKPKMKVLPKEPFSTREKEKITISPAKLSTTSTKKKKTFLPFLLLLGFMMVLKWVSMTLCWWPYVFGQLWFLCWTQKQFRYETCFVKYSNGLMNRDVPIISTKFFDVRRERVKGLSSQRPIKTILFSKNHFRYFNWSM